MTDVTMVGGVLLAESFIGGNVCQSVVLERHPETKGETTMGKRCYGWTSVVGVAEAELAVEWTLGIMEHRTPGRLLRSKFTQQQNNITTAS